MERRLRGMFGPTWTAPLFLLLFSQWEVWLGGQTHPTGPGWATSASAALSALLLVVRRRSPLLVQGGVVVFMVLPWLVWGAPQNAAAFLIGMTATYAVGRWGRRPTAYWGVPVAVGWTLLQLALDPMQANVAAGWGWSLWGVAAWASGAWVRQHAELDGRRDTAREAESRAELAEQRLRIARDLHDVLANSLGVMVVHAEAAEELLSVNPGRAAEAMRRVQTTGREALTEVRDLLGPLRAANSELDASEPGTPRRERRTRLSEQPRQPGLENVDSLVDRMRQAGLPLAYDRVGDRPVPADVAEVVYRLLQEALTNVVRHAGLVPTHARVSTGPEAITVDVVDDGSPTRAAVREPATVGGNGIVGMRERLHAFGGTLEICARPEGGLHVSSVIPLQRPDEPVTASVQSGWAPTVDPHR